VIVTALIRKIIQVGTSKAVTIPKSWLEFFTKRNGQPINYVGMEINDKITIWPILKEWESSCEAK
jgi:antitoxin component of MazEF toxin-antitoxin module